jgi:hypothetical protein
MTSHSKLSMMFADVINNSYIHTTDYLKEKIKICHFEKYSVKVQSEDLENRTVNCAEYTGVRGH